MSKTLILYVFHEVNERVDFFVKNALLQNDADFLFISNGKNNVLELPEYVDILFRENVGYDFGGWSDGLFRNDRYQKYENFIFVNSSSVGPFCTSAWPNHYLSGLVGNVKLFGSTINCAPNPHVQSNIFSMNKETLNYLIECEIFSPTKYTQSFDDTIWEKEVKMSQKIIEAGWNIGCLMKHYENVDFTFKEKQPQDYNILFLGDVMFDRWINVYWKPSEIVFVKGNRITNYKELF